ncbi:MAG: peptidase M1 [Deltaproteobacteria bacterium]|nr:peptidase M1 [Deltaproteobacteria bacterium]
MPPRTHRTPLALLAGLALGCGAEGSADDAEAGDAPLEGRSEESAADADADGDVADVGDAADAGDVWDAPFPPSENLGRDILHIDLVIDLAALSGTATILVAPSSAPGASFEAGGLDVRSVTGPAGPCEFVVVDGRLDVGLPASVEAALVVEYGFLYQVDFEGLSRRGYVLDWPNHCGNVFPCHSHPTEGQTFTLEVLGVPPPDAAVYAAELSADAPSYQLSWAMGQFIHQEVGTTTAGTRLVVWTVAGRETAAAEGMADLPAVFDWYERTLGPYPFGDLVGAVAVNWPPTAYGGIEHHPYWHVSRFAIGDRLVHVHEAAHGWFGDGVRIARWEDLVLSEGTVCYLAARALGQTVGPEAEAETWADYEAELAAIVAGSDRVAWPDELTDPVELEEFLFSRSPYMKGAMFYRAVAEEVGAAELDRVLAAFFAAHAGRAAGMQDMLDRIAAETGFDPTVLADGWLRSLGSPAP